ncbi:MAG: SseB family protein [Methanobrevibacter sp.]|uniref:SseB family protein n=1 Tax=Methanobrevibacter sp. TaxID=66852 RepID=UPI0026DFD453|nr:SseB family protein [Methanobrevibacter sp.]MDO5849065.1 SseB family protein [Methanobrevibacter sp.]
MNQRLKEIMENPIEELTEGEKEELFNIIRETELILPVEIYFDDEVVEEIEPVMIRTYSGKIITPLFTDEEELEDKTILTMQLPTAEIVKLMEDFEVEGVVINPFNKNMLAISVNTLSQLFLPEFEEVVSELRGLLYQNSTTLGSDTELYIRTREPIGEEFIPEIPINASSNPEFRKEYPYLNILRLSKGDRIMYVGNLVDETKHPDVVIAPETEFKLIEKNGNEYIWKCMNQPFYK